MITAGQTGYIEVIMISQNDLLIYFFNYYANKFANFIG
jgi:hypothetical protein